MTLRPLTTEIRAAVVAVSATGLVLARSDALWIVATAALAGVFAATRVSTRVAIGLLGFVMAAGVPWIAAPLMVGVVWLVV
ncbi:hypothetical protein [Demequina sp. NBRC 110052]|uniref:hypothetical protein n=1 Tax=Demequina sp. NBRC 110052 TaxID=1570341 RepID=UPI000A076B32|nr:hypothetical protein [Demequina sp. NBRC 110052]